MQVALHDANTGRRRMPVYSDFLGYTLASIGDTGTAYASHSNSDHLSTIMYRPFESWAAKVCFGSLVDVTFGILVDVFGADINVFVPGSPTGPFCCL